MTKIAILKEVYDRASAVLKPHEAKAILSNIEGLVKGAILDPSEEIRKGLIKVLGEIFPGMLRSGFEADGQLYLSLEYKENRGIFLICDMPKEYAGCLSKPSRFDIYTK